MSFIHREPPDQLPSVDPIDFLVVAPHPDDAELGMGGTIAKMTDAGYRVGILDLTSGEPTPHGSEAIRQKETQAATDVLGVAWRGNAGLPNRSLEHTLDGRKLIASYFRVLKPRWIFAPFWQDAHPDHVAATEMIEAARFWSKLSKTDMPGDRHHPQRIYYYFCIHLRLAVQPSWIIDISEHWDRKIESIRAYHSQFIAGRPQTSPTFLERLRDDAAYWGRLIDRHYGEPFATKEPLAVSSLRDFI